MAFPRIPARYVYIVFAFMCTFNLYSLRINLSVAIVDMVKFDKHSMNDSAPVSNNSTQSTETEHAKKFFWTGSQQGLILSCYYYGYMVTQVLGAYLGRRFGRVRVLGITTILSSTLSVLFPVIARRIGYVGAVVARICIGLFSGVTMPTLFACTSAWAPKAERSKFVALQFAGIPSGTCAVLPVAGLLAARFGWESIFYATGGLGLLWSISWLILIYESPKCHPRLSSIEKNLFVGSTHRVDEKSPRKTRKVPWFAILKSKAWICLAFTHFSSLFGKYQLMSMLPSYLKTVLNFNVKSSGILSSIPFLLGALLLFVSGPLADCLIARKIRSIIVRKGLTITGLMMSSFSIIIVTYIGPSVPAAMTLFTLSVAMDSLVVPGFKACLMEIAPEFSGVCYGMSNTVSTLSGIIAPQITGSLRQRFGDDSLTGWRVSFWIGGVIYFLGALAFLLFGTNEKQPWAYEKEKKNEVKEELASLERSSSQQIA